MSCIESATRRSLLKVLPFWYQFLRAGRDGCKVCSFLFLLPLLGTIQQIKAKDSKHADSEWQRLCVVWDEDHNSEEYEGLERLSNWEIMPEGESDGTPELVYTITEQESQRISEALKQLSKSPVAEPFSRAVDTKVYTDYLSFVPLPMDVSMVLRRLERKFYRSISALQSDLELIARNACIFNKPGTHEYNLARKLAPVFSALLKGDEWQAANSTVEAAPQQTKPFNSSSLKIRIKNPLGTEPKDAELPWEARATKALQRFSRFNRLRVESVVTVAVPLERGFLPEVRVQMSAIPPFALSSSFSSPCPNPLIWLVV